MECLLRVRRWALVTWSISRSKRSSLDRRWQRRPLRRVEGFPGATHPPPKRSAVNERRGGTIGHSIQPAEDPNDFRRGSIVGLWHTVYTSGGVTAFESF